MTVTPQDNADFGATDTPTDAPTDAPASEAPASDAPVEAETPQEAVDRLDLDQYGNYRVTVKVAGEEVEMPLSEALAGTMRHADYTRKTQEIAAEKERLAGLERLEHWLEVDPAGTIKALQESLGLTEPLEQEADVDPVEARLRAIEQEREKEREELRVRTVVAEANQALASNKLDGLAPEDLLQYALDNRVGDLNVAARLYKIERAESLKQADVERTVESKRAASVVSGGSSTVPASTVPARPPKMSLREAFEAALNA